MDLTSFGVGNNEDNSKQYKKLNETQNDSLEQENNFEEIVDNKLDLDFSKLKKDFKIDEIERFLPWFLKYKLKKFDDLIVTSEIKKILNFIENKPKGKGLLLVGRAGSGKTTTLSLLAEKYNLELFEINASDARNKKSIEQTLGDVIKQKSLFAKDKLILVDEVDGVSGTNDRGGVAQIIKYIKDKNNTVSGSYYLVFAANDPDSNKIKALKKACIVVDFENHSVELLFNIGKRILEKEKIKYSEDDLKKFVEERSTIDIRGFINDLQVSVVDGNFCLDENLEIRDYKKKIDGLLEKIYYSYPEDSLFSTFNSDINLDDLFLYLEENTPKVYSKNSQILSFDRISKADIYRGRIRKFQYWRFLVYVNFYLTFAVSEAKGNNLKKVKKFERNSRILKKWIYNNKYNSIRARTKLEKKNGMNKKFIERLANYYGVSASRCRKEDLFYFVISYRNDEKFQEKMDLVLDIDSSIKKVLMEI